MQEDVTAWKRLLVLGDAVQFDICRRTRLLHWNGCRGCEYSELEFGSIGGGGRYDELTKSVGGQNLPGVGISFELDQIVNVMDALERWPDASHGKPLILFIRR